MKFNKLVPELSVSDIDKSIGFYTKILGFKTEYRREESKFIFLSLQGSQIMLEEINGHWETGKLEYPLGRGINFQIEVDDVNKIVESLKKHNYPMKIMPSDNWYRKGKKLLGCREFLVMDPDGYLLRFSQNLGTRTLAGSSKTEHPASKNQS
ncbi:Glyoxalase/Bleomycin resistance protein/Dioxygenase superfamily protein [uncultured archaeon]|nr:Glyoxalase/Bleomycin resistance protein/Dioxygenase superfamily protein [uncultured archaeon]